MTLPLPLTPEQETRLLAEAEHAGMPLVDYVLRRLFGDRSSWPAGYSEEWTDEDMRDLTRYSLSNAEEDDAQAG